MADRYLIPYCQNLGAYVPDHSNLKFSNSVYTVEMWIKQIASFGETSKLLSKGDDVIGWRIFAGNNSIYNGLYTEVGDGENYVGVTVAHNFVIGEWVHIVVVYDKSIALPKFYINGVLKTGTDVSEPGIDMTDLGTIASTLTLDFTNNIGYDGVGIYNNKALTLEEIQARYLNDIGAKFAGSETGLTWGSNFDSTSGTVITDIKGTQNGVITDDLGSTWSSGGVPYPNLGSENYYLLKRDEDIVTYLFDPILTNFNVTDDFSLLSAGTYSYTLTPISKYTDEYDSHYEGEPSDPLYLTIDEYGVLQEYPDVLISSLYINPAAGGTFIVSWKYSGGSAFTPTSFNIYWTLTIDEYGVPYGWCVTPENTTYTGGSYKFTTTQTWSTGDVVYFKVQPVNDPDEYSSFETTDDITFAHGTADAQAPVIDDIEDTIIITVID